MRREILDAVDLCHLGISNPFFDVGYFNEAFITFPGFNVEFIDLLILGDHAAGHFPCFHAHEPGVITTGFMDVRLDGEWTNIFQASHIL